MAQARAAGAVTEYRGRPLGLLGLEPGGIVLGVVVVGVLQRLRVGLAIARQRVLDVVDAGRGAVVGLGRDRLEVLGVVARRQRADPVMDLLVTEPRARKSVVKGTRVSVRLDLGG